MTIKPIANDDWELFCVWAEAEGWKISFQEQYLFKNQLRPYFYVLWHNGERCGFISAVIYKTSGWIGNLIVPEEKRGCGYGTKLLDYSITKLKQAHLDRIWLTASAQGAPLYRRRNFKTVDRVVRWKGLGTGTKKNRHKESLKTLIELDLFCWKESRSSLINLLADNSILIKSSDSIALLQQSLDFWQLGPWVAKNMNVLKVKQLLEKTIAITPDKKPLVLDVLHSSGLNLLLSQTGFIVEGQNDLMCLSQKQVTLSGVISLASLGSIG